MPVANPWLEEFLVEEREIKKPTTLRGSVTNEEKSNTRELDPLGKLVEKVGRQTEFFARHCEEWPTEKRNGHYRKLLASHNELDAALGRSKRRPTDYGWEVTLTGRWQRVGEAPEPEAPTTTEQILRGCMGRVGEALADLPRGACDGAEWAAIESELGEAAAAGDLERLTTACLAYEDLARETALQLRPLTLAEAREALWAFGQWQGFPELELGPGMRLEAGEEAWAKCLDCTPTVLNHWLGRVGVWLLLAAGSFGRDRN